MLIYTNFKGEARAKKSGFLIKFFQKMLKNANVGCGAKILAKTGFF